MSVEAQTIDTAEALNATSAAWRDLWRRARAPTIFQHPDWLIPWWRHFAPGELASIALWRGDNLVGLAPLYREEATRRLLPLGISLSDYLDVLIAKEDSASILREMERRIAQISCASEICFPDVAPDAMVLRLAANELVDSKSPGQLAPELALGAADNPLKNVPAHQRQNLRTAENRGRRRGCMTREVKPEELTSFLPALLQLHSARRRELGDAGLADDPRVPPFFADAFGKLSHAGLLRAYSLSCEERFIGGYVGFLHADRACYYFGGFDPAFSFESPGTVLIGHAMRRAAAEGAQKFDFLRGGEPYKYAWGARDRQLLSVTLTRQFSHADLIS